MLVPLGEIKKSHHHLFITLWKGDKKVISPFYHLFQKVITKVMGCWLSIGKSKKVTITFLSPFGKVIKMWYHILSHFPKGDERWYHILSPFRKGDKLWYHLFITFPKCDKKRWWWLFWFSLREANIPSHVYHMLERW